MGSSWILPLLFASGSLTALLEGGQASVQDSAVTVSRRVVVSSDLPDAPHVEPRLALDPTNPQRLLIGAMLFRRDGGGDSECSPLVSFDAGATWRRSVLPKREGVTGGGDPWVAFDRAGTAFFSCLHGVRTDAGERTSGVGVYRSTDGGLTWAGPAMLSGRAYDRPVLVVGSAGGSSETILHVVASQGTRREFGAANPIAISTSIDGGRTFAEPVHVLFNNLNNNVRSAISLKDGTVMVVFYDVGSLDGRPLEQFRIWSVRSTDGARTFGPALFVNENAGGDQADVDVGPTGTLVAVWDVVRGPRTGRGVFFATSNDNGFRWTAGKRLAELGSGDKQQHVPTVAVRSDGAVGTLWIDYRNDPRGACSDVYFRASMDSGATWLQPERVSLKPSCPQSPSNTIVRTDGRPNDIARRWSEGGDYHGLVGGDANRFHAAWSDSSTGTFQIHFATIELGKGVAPSR